MKIVVLAALFVVLLQAQPVTPAAPPVAEVWVGHHIVHGKRKVPILGEFKTRVDVYLVADVRREGDRVELKPHTCRMDMAPGMGSASMSAVAQRRIPQGTIRLRVGPDGRATASDWTIGYGAEDLDGDGHPGVSVMVDAPMCDGTMYLSDMSNVTLLNGRADADGFFGNVSIRLHERVLGASSRCLRWGDDDIHEVQSGRLLYRKAPAGTSCASLQGKPWPVKASE